MHVTVSIACADETQARAIARRLIEERLAACAQSVPIESCYRWRGEVATEREVLLLVKTRSEVFERLAQAVRTMHSYEVPEITMTPIAGGTDEYLRWIDESVSGG